MLMPQPGLSRRQFEAISHSPVKRHIRLASSVLDRRAEIFSVNSSCGDWRSGSGTEPRKGLVYCPYSETSGASRLVFLINPDAGL